MRNGTATTPKHLRGELTSGVFAKACSKSSRTCCMWIDEAIAQIADVKSAGAYDELRSLWREGKKEAFSDRLEAICQQYKWEHINRFTQATLEGCPSPYRFEGKEGDRRVPRATAVRFFKLSGMESAVAALGVRQCEIDGIVFACDQFCADYQEQALEGLDTSRFVPVSTESGIATGATIEKLRHQNEGAYPLIVADTSIGQGEVKALLRLYAHETDVVVVASADADKNEYKALGAKAVFKRGECDVAAEVAGAINAFVAKVQTARQQMVS